MDPAIVELGAVYVETAAVVAGGLSGAMHARSRGYDLVGVLVISLVTGVGGGILRDVLIGHGPPLALEQPFFLLSAVAASILATSLARVTEHLERPIAVIDSLQIGLFAAAGARRALQFSLPPLAAVFLGVVTCTGGSLIRDVLCREVPTLLVPGSPYAILGLLSASVYVVLMVTFGGPRWLALVVAVALATGLRLIALHRGWYTRPTVELWHRHPPGGA